MLNVEYKVRSGGGHASAPKPHSPLVALSEACTKIESHPFKRTSQSQWPKCSIRWAVTQRYLSHDLCQPLAVRRRAGFHLP